MKGIILLLFSIQIFASIALPESVAQHLQDCSKTAISEEMIYDPQYVDEYIVSAQMAMDRTGIDNHDERVALWFEGIFLSHSHRKYQAMTANLIDLMQTHPNPTILSANETHIRNCLENEQCLAELPSGLMETMDSLTDTLVSEPIEQQLLDGYVEVIDMTLNNCIN